MPNLKVKSLVMSITIMMSPDNYFWNGVIVGIWFSFSLTAFHASLSHYTCIFDGSLLLLFSFPQFMFPLSMNSCSDISSSRSKNNE